jgi:glycosyltransferase involved in cell wall biosynthesis
MKPVRVLQILTCDDLGGTEMMVATLVERLDRLLVEPSVVTLEPPGPIAERLGGMGVPVRSLGGSGLAVAFARLARILRHDRFEVVNAYGFKSTAVVRFLVRALAPGTRFVSGVRGLHVAELEEIDGTRSQALLRMERLGAGLVDAYDANSRGAVELLARTGIDRKRLHYIANGIDVESWPAACPGQTADSAPTILCVARFVPRKRHADLIEAVALLARSGLECRLVMVGGGPTLSESRRLAARLGLHAPRVTFRGPASPDEVRDLAVHAHIFCLPSLWEGMAGGVMEAMASGLPVVGTDVNGIADLVEPGRTGLLVPPRNPLRLSQALAEVLQDPGKRADWGAAGRTRIRDHFGVDQMVAAKERLFVSLGQTG